MKDYKENLINFKKWKEIILNRNYMKQKIKLK